MATPIAIAVDQLGRCKSGMVGSYAFRVRSLFNFVPRPFRTQRGNRLIDVPARVVAVEAESDASLAVPCQHPAPRDSLDDRLRARRWNANARTMPRRIGWRERGNSQDFQSLQHRRRHALDVRLNVAHIAGGQIV